LSSWPASASCWRISEPPPRGKRRSPSFKRVRINPSSPQSPVRWRVDRQQQVSDSAACRVIGQCSVSRIRFSSHQILFAAENLCGNSRPAVMPPPSVFCPHTCPQMIRMALHCRGRLWTVRRCRKRRAAVRPYVDGHVWTSTWCFDRNRKSFRKPRECWVFGLLIHKVPTKIPTKFHPSWPVVF
jgi:hypothetical protein